MPSDVIRTAERLRDAERDLCDAIMPQTDRQELLRAIRRYSDAVLSHHLAVEKAKAPAQQYVTPMA